MNWAAILGNFFIHYASTACVQYLLPHLYVNFICRLLRNNAECRHRGQATQSNVNLTLITFLPKFINCGAIMTFTSDSAATGLSNALNYGNQPGDAVTSTTAVFQSLSIDDQLAVLWYAYTEMGRSITPAATGAARLQLAEGLLTQIKQMSHADQLNVMRDLAAQRNTPICRSYGILSNNTKLAFWYELSELMVKGLVAPMPVGYQLSRDGVQVLEAIKKLDFGQQITVLRKVVAEMGIDPLAD